MKGTALVTGATGRIGQAIAHQLASEGFYLFLHYNKGKDTALSLQKELEHHYGINAFCVGADLSEPEGASHLMSQLHGNIETAVLTSGSSYYGLITDMRQEDIQKEMQLNLISPILLIKGLLPFMIRNKKGKIVAVSSIWGQTGASCESVYSAAKGGINTFVKAIAKETAPSGIQINAVAPGAIDSGMMDRFSQEELKTIEEEIPAGRMGLPIEVAHAVSYLVSDHASYVNGHVLSLNGAWYT